MLSFWENTGNVFQAIVMVGLVLYLLWNSQKVSVKFRSALYFQAGGYVCQILGLIFWTLFLIIRNNTIPEYLSAYDISIVGCFLFFISTYSACLHTKQDKQRKRELWKNPRLWIAPILVLLNMCMWLIAYGNYVMNILWGVCMTVLAWYASYGILRATDEKQDALKPYYWSTIAFLMIAMILFISPSIMYVIMNFVQTLSMVAMTVTLERGVRKCSI